MLTSPRLDNVAGRYWSEVGQEHAGARNTERQIGFLIEFLGKDTLITDIVVDEVATLVGAPRWQAYQCLDHQRHD